MPGYCLLEQGTSLPASTAAGGVPPDRLGFLDFLRELSGDDAAIPKFWNVVVVGLDEVLFAAGTESGAIAREIHRRLRAAAPILEARLATITVEFRGQLKRGDELWSEYRGARLPIGHIFGSPPPQVGPDNRKIYFTNFNLTHGG